MATKLPRALLFLLLASILFWPAQATAHAIVVASSPESRQIVAKGELRIEVRFNSRIDRARSRLTLTAPGQVKSTLAIDPDGPPAIMTAKATLTPGDYVVRWQVLAVDGHITRGDVPFTVTGH